VLTAICAVAAIRERQSFGLCGVILRHEGKPRRHSDRYALDGL
jgi:hypothetical protein